MASGFFAVLDDIASLMDDVAVTTKIAATKTVGILGDDLAVNAEKATGFIASRELPVLWAITKGSLLNKLIIVPVALLLSAFFPAAINVLLVLGGVYLAYEGVEKIIEFLFHRSKSVHTVVFTEEKAKIKAAVTTDFILSIEIVIIALGEVAEQSLPIQILSVSAVAVLATIGVYGIVALIVRTDDAGLRLIKSSGSKSLFISKLGLLLVRALPVVIKVLAVVGTLALVLVSGGIFTHHIGFLHHLVPGVPAIFKEITAGLGIGLLAVGVMTTGRKIRELI